MIYIRIRDIKKKSLHLSVHGCAPRDSRPLILIAVHQLKVLQSVQAKMSLLFVVRLLFVRLQSRKGGAAEPNLGLAPNGPRRWIGDAPVVMVANLNFFDAVEINLVPLHYQPMNLVFRK